MTSVASAGLLVGRLLALASLIALMSEAVARTGAGVLPFVLRRPTSALERFGLGLLFGFSLLGFVYFSLALVGLFVPLVLAGVCLAFLGGSRAMWQRRFLLVEAFREGRAAGILGLVALTLGLVPVVWKLLLPEVHPDSWAYHLGAPWQYLQTGRMVYEHVPLAFHHPLPFEAAFALPLIVGDDRLAKIMVWLCFMAASAVFAGRCLKAGDPDAAWLGPLLVLSSGALLLTVSKSDVPAAALFVTGAVLQLKGAWAPGALLLGLCLASKRVYGPEVVVWVICFLPPRRLLGWCAALLLLPSLPWLAKSYLLMGNPVYPFASEWFPSLGWSAANREGFGQYLAANLEGKELREAGLPEAWFMVMRGRLPVLLALPGLVLMSRHRRAVAACVAAQVLLLGIVRVGRYMMPPLWLLALLVAEGAGRLPGHLKKVAIAVLGGYALAVIALSSRLHQPDWKRAWAPWSQLKPRLTTYLDVERWLERPGRAAVSWRPRAPRVRRVLTIGELRTYSFPFRVISNEMWGVTPVVWKLAHESQDVAELSKKFRQLGAKRLLYNYVSVEFSSIWYGSFPWKQDALRRYVEFCKRHLVRLGRSEQADFTSGGFYVYEIRRQPVLSPPSEIWFAPGTEAVYGAGLRLRTMHRNQEALKEYRKILTLLPDVGQAWNRVGHAYLQLNDFPNALKYLLRFGERGMMDGMNLGDLGSAALGVGRFDLAERVLADALRRYPHRRNSILTNQASWHVQKALQELAQRRVDAAERYVKRGLMILEDVPENLERDSAAGRRTTLASLFGVKGEVYLVRGKEDLAAEWFSRAAQLAPEMPMAPRWRKLSSKPGPRVFQGSRAPQ